jgi:hypothetical protein
VSTSASRHAAHLVAAVAAAAVVTTTLATSASAHRSGSWMYPPQVAFKLSAKGFDAASCTGKGHYHFTNRSTPNNHQTWQFKHFECFEYNGIGYPGVVFICVHSLAGSRIMVTKVMQNNAYRRCTF